MSIYKKRVGKCTYQFPVVVKNISYLYCKFDTYQKCLIYAIIIDKKPHCNYFNECCVDFQRLVNLINENTTSIEEFTHFFYEF